MIAMQARLRIGCLLLTSLLLPRVGSPSPADALEKAAVAVRTAHLARYEGRLFAARDELLRLVRNELGALDNASGRVVVVQLLETCLSMGDLSCLLEIIPVLDSIPDPAKDHAPLVAAANVQESLYFREAAQLLMLQADLSEERVSQTKSHLTQTDAAVVVFSSRRYVDRQLVRAALHDLLDQTAEARVALHRALVTLASLENPELDRLWVLSRLVDIISLLRSLGDHELAMGLFGAVAGIVDASFPARSIERLKLDLLVSDLALEKSGEAMARARLIDALVLLQGIELPSDFLARLSAAMRARLAIVCLVLDDSACVEEALAGHPSRSRLSQDDPFFGTAIQDLEFAYLSALYARYKQAVIPAGVDGVFAFLAEANDPAKYWYANLLSNAGLSVVASATGDERTARRAARTAAAVLAGRLNRQLNAESYLVAPSLLERAILLGGLDAFASGRNLKGDDADLAIASIELLKRTRRVREGDGLALQASAQGPGDRAEVHAFLRLGSRWRIRIVSAIRELADDLVDAPIQADGFGDFNTDWRRRLDLSDLALLETRLAASLRDAAQSRRVPDLVPARWELQGALRKDEAFIALAISGSYIRHLCVRHNKVRVFTNRVDPVEYDRDRRLVLSALSADHAPSAALDRQFPVAASHRLYGTIIRPVERCLSGVEHLIWSPDPEVGVIPLAALVVDPGQENEGDVDLGAVQWLAGSMGTSLVTSARHFLGSRAIRPSVSSEGRFIGIGDPILAAEMDSRSDPVPGAIVESSKRPRLPELPETAQELLHVAAVFDGRATVLLRQEATEQRLRREVLSQYRYIHFATHALMREEAPGLREPALLLTAGEGRDDLDDGLLGASEIADLRVQAELVVLSACNTAEFEPELFASEVQGLATAFALAGAPATVATLWAIDSPTAQKIVSDLFRALEESSRSHPAGALAAAQRGFISRSRGTPYAHPRFWAPFVLMGDGGRADSSSAETNKGRAIETHVVSRSLGSEIVSVAASDEGSWYLSGIGDLRGGRHSWLMGKIDSHGEPVARMETRGVGAGPILGVVDDGVIVAGYQAGKGTIEAVVFRKIGSHGNLIWERSLAGLGPYPLVLGAVARGPGAFAVAIAPMGGGSVRDDFVRIVEIGGEGTIEERAKVKAESWLSVQGGFVARGAELLLFVGDRLGFGNAPPSEAVDRLHNRRYCGRSATTTAFAFDADTFSLKDQWKIDGVSIADVAIASDGRILGVGTEVSGCPESSRLVIADLTVSATAEILFRDTSAFDTSGVAILGERRGWLWLSGSMDRVIDASRQTSRDAGDYLRAGPRLSHDRFMGSLLLGFRSSDGASVREFVDAGGDAVLGVGFVRETEIIAGGYVAGQAAWFQLRQ